MRHMLLLLLSAKHRILCRNNSIDLKFIYLCYDKELDRISHRKLLDSYRI